MDPVSPLPALACLSVAAAVCFLLAKRFGAPPAQGRFVSVDGLRGYLAFFVFLHHSCIWYFYLRTGKWRAPSSNLYTHFGQSSVALFFMITGFLFFSKLIDARKKGIDWLKLFVSRFLRLVPLYLFAILLLFSVVAYVSHGDLNEPLPKLLKGVVKWVGFTILGAPDLNRVEDTPAVVAWVTWSLPYEWFFYFSLPVLALSVRVMPPIRFLALGLVSIVALVLWQPQIHHLASFAGGIAAAFLVRSERFRQFAVTKSASVISLGCAAAVVVFYPSTYATAPLFLLSAAFIPIACGNSLFGALTHPASRTLGEMGYSIYLLHGIALFVTFNFIIGLDPSRALSAFSHWLVALGITPVLVCGCFLTFRFIERPAMRSTGKVTAWLRARPLRNTLEAG